MTDLAGGGKCNTKFKETCCRVILSLEPIKILKSPMGVRIIPQSLSVLTRGRAGCSFIEETEMLLSSRSARTEDISLTATRLQGSPRSGEESNAPGNLAGMFYFQLVPATMGFGNSRALKERFALRGGSSILLQVFVQWRFKSHERASPKRDP